MVNIDYLNIELPAALNKNELLEYLKKMKNGDKDAKDVIIMHNLRLITSYINSNHLSRKDKEDLFYVGVEGLTIAVNTFDITKNFAFSSYATKCIKNSIIAYIKKENKEAKVLYLEQPFAADKDGEELSLFNIIPDNYNIFEDIELKESLCLLREILEKLPKEQKDLIQSRFKLNGDENLRENVDSRDLTTSERIPFKIRLVLREINRQYVNIDKITGEKYLKLKK